jgi:hypothetical protein
VRRSGRRPARAAIALAGLGLTVVGCGHVLPLGPTPAATPVPRQLASPIVMELGLSQPGAPASGCPAGSVALSGPGTTTVTTDGNFTSTTTGLCYRQLAEPVTFTSGGVTLYQQPPSNNPAEHLAPWLLRITLPAAEAAALAAITTQAVNSQAQIAIIVAGQTWEIPSTPQPLTNGQFDIAAQSKDQALQLQRLLLKPA